MHKIFLLFYFILPTLTTNYTFPNLTITLNLISQTTIDYSTGNTCRKILIRDTTVHHLSTINIYKNWNKGNLNVTNALINFNSSGISLNDFDADQPVDKAIFNAYGLFGSSTNYIYSLNQNGTVITNTSQSLSTTPNLVFINRTDVYYFFGSSIKKSNTTTTLVLGIWSLVRTYESMAVSPNFQKAMIWD